MIEVRGGPEQLARISRQLKEEANRGLRRELTKALGEATKPLRADIKTSALANLPKRGGLATLVAKSRISNRRVVKGSIAGVRLVGTNRHTLRGLERGVIKHPVFADAATQTREQWTWVTQYFWDARGWWSKPIKDAAPEVKKEIEEAIGRISDRLERAGRGL